MADSDAWIPYRPPGETRPAQPREPAPAPATSQRSPPARPDEPPLHGRIDVVPEEADVDVPEEAEIDVVPEDAEIVDGLPVLADVRELAPVRVGTIPAVQAAAAAATGFVAGAATMALARRVAIRRLGRIGPAHPPLRGPLFPASGTRTFLVHIRVLGRPPE